MSKSKSVPKINTSVKNTRSAGQIFLPASEEESAALFTLKPSFTSPFPSIFHDPRYEIPAENEFDDLALPSSRSCTGGQLPYSYYPMALVDACPSFTKDRDTLTFAEGRHLYLALSFAEETICAALDTDPKTGLYLESVSDSRFFKDCLDLASPALVRYFLHIFLVKTF